MEENETYYQKKWDFLDKKLHKPGMIIDGEDDIEIWMNYSPYEAAQDRLNKGSVEDTIIEFVEFFWSIEPNYRLLRIILQMNFIRSFQENDIIIKANYIDRNKKKIPKIKEIQMTLDPDTEYIQTFELILYEMPDVTILNEKIKQISQELEFKKENNTLKLMVSGKVLIISN